MKIFGTDGIRGIANKELTPEFALLIGKAVGSVLIKKQNARIIIGRDTRVSCDMIESALASGLCSVGVDVVLIGVAPTPAVAFLSNTADAGIMISASHNSYEFNGIKIFKSDGYKLPDELEEEIEKIIRSEKGIEVSEKIGKISKEDLCKKYISYIKKTINLANASDLKVVFDLANGAASSTAFGIFGFEINDSKFLNDRPNGININKNCGSLHTQKLSNFVTKNNFDVGIAFDGDADRCFAIDEKGALVDGDTIMAICANYMKKRNILSKNTVVGTIMTNFGFNKFCQKNNINLVSTKVGDRYVLETMSKGDFNLGGEQSGHIIFKDFSTTGDGQLTAAILIKILKESGKKLSELSKCIEKFPQVTLNLKATDDQKTKILDKTFMNNVLKDFREKLGEEGRVLVRPSGTEPLIRIMIEWTNKKEIESLANKILETISKRTLEACSCC